MVDWAEGRAGMAGGRGLAGEARVVGVAGTGGWGVWVVEALAREAVEVGAWAMAGRGGAGCRSGMWWRQRTRIDPLHSRSA